MSKKVFLLQKIFFLPVVILFFIPASIAAPGASYTTVEERERPADREQDGKNFRPILAKFDVLKEQSQSRDNHRYGHRDRERNRDRDAAGGSGGSLTDFVRNNSETRGRNSLNEMAKEFLLENPEVKYLGKPEWGGSDIRDKDGRPLPGFVNPAQVKGAGPLGTVFPPTPANAMGWSTESKVAEGMYYQMLSGLDGFNGWPNSDLKEFSQKVQSGNLVAKTVQYPLNAADQARAEFTAQMTALGNAAGDVAKEQAASAIEYCAKFMENFTAQPGSKWNQIRESLFVPIGLLLLLPGAILSQIRATVGFGMPLQTTNPFDGLLRSVVAIFLIPATYLVVNYSIDFSNSITFTLASEYQRIFSSNVYNDAVCSEIRAFPVRGPKENQNAGIAETWPQTESTSFERLEKNLYKSKIDDPCSGAYSAPESRTDEGMPLSSVFGRLLAFGGNALLTSAWNVLCAFQMAYMLYLFWVGPVVAGLWVWPIKQFRDALPNWVEGVITLAFWSLFWNTAILLMACFKGMADTGTVYETALNFLATASVKYAFDFAGLIKAAGQEASKATGVAGSSGRPESAAGGGSSGTTAPASAATSGGAGAAVNSSPSPAILSAPLPVSTRSARNATSLPPNFVAPGNPSANSTFATNVDTDPLDPEVYASLTASGAVPFNAPNLGIPLANLDPSEFPPPPGETTIARVEPVSYQALDFVPAANENEVREPKAGDATTAVEWFDPASNGTDHNSESSNNPSLVSRRLPKFASAEWIFALSELGASGDETVAELDAKDTDATAADLVLNEGDKDLEEDFATVEPADSVASTNPAVGRLLGALGRAAGAEPRGSVLGAYKFMI